MNGALSRISPSIQLILLFVSYVHQVSCAKLTLRRLVGHFLIHYPTKLFYSTWIPFVYPQEIQEGKEEDEVRIQYPEKEETNKNRKFLSSCAYSRETSFKLCYHKQLLSYPFHELYRSQRTRSHRKTSGWICRGSTSSCLHYKKFSNSHQTALRRSTHA